MPWALWRPLFSTPLLTMTISGLRAGEESQETVWQLEDVLIITLVAEFISPQKYILSVL